MMHVFSGSQKISQVKFSDHEFDETKVKFIQISRGEAVLFKSRTLFGHFEYNSKVDSAGVSKTNDPVHDIAIHCYINLPGYNNPPEEMNLETHVLKYCNGEKKIIDGYFEDENDFENMYVVKYRDIKVHMENDQLEKNDKKKKDPTNDASYQYAFN